MQTPDAEQFRAGFVSIVGRPNVGKSTLVNCLIGSKLSIVSPKPQTTRGTVRGILTTDDAQIVFFDTAGLHRPTDRLGQYMVATARNALLEADLAYLLVEAKMPGTHEQELIEQVCTGAVPVFLVVNKIDRLSKSALVPILAAYGRLYAFDDIIPVSARTGDNVDRLVALTVGRLPVAEPFFPADIVSDQIEREFISEFIREQVYRCTQEEIPYSAAVVVEEMQEREGGGAYIRAIVYLAKDSQKGILIGKGGAMIRQIGRAARSEIEQFLGYPVYLDLQVKVEKGWRKKINALRKLGYRQP